MCIVIDLNVLAHVFKKDSNLHGEFKPVLDWITRRRAGGQVVYGGTKYKAELERTKYLRLFRQLKTASLAVEIQQELVDKREAELAQMSQGTGCDDQHLIAILCVSGCMLVCSLDRRAYPYIRDRQNYAGRRKVPKIYSSRKHKRLLCPMNCPKLRNIVCSKR